MNISLEHITKRYGSFTALNDFSASFSSGIYGLLGPNGAGKSTLINIIVGLLRSSSGSIRLDGKDVAEMGEGYLEHIGYLPQYPSFYRNFTVLDFMRYMAVLKDIRKNDIDSRIMSILGFLGLSEQRNKKTAHLSGGMRQRLGIAQALINDPQLLILDEPTAGLDPKERIRFRNLISRLAEGRTILLATHIVADVEFTAKEIILLHNGQKLIQDTPEALVSKINGMVWTAEVGADRLNELFSKYSVSSARNTNHGYELRFISEKKPELENAQLAVPELEDVYLYCFGEGDER